MIAATRSRLLRYVVCAFAAAGGLGAVFVLGKRVRRKEVFVLLAVFETVLLTINGIHAVFLVTQNREGAPAAVNTFTDTFTVDPETPSPNIYWLFMDGMLGFEGMERLFGDSQDAFAEALAGQGFLVNRNAEFEVFHSTKRATAALMCPSWYDEEFLPLLRTVNLDDYVDKEKKLSEIDPLSARRNNELIRAFRAKGYTVNSISVLWLYQHNSFYEITDALFYENRVLSDAGSNFFVSYPLFLSLNDLLNRTLAPWRIISGGIKKTADSLFAKIFNAEDILQGSVDKTAFFGDAYDGSDQWYVDALVQTFGRAEPRFTIIHDLKTHCPFDRNEDGLLQTRSEEMGLDPSNYPPQHRYTAKIVLAYTALILEHDPDAIIVIQADHGLHHEESRKALLKQVGSEEDARVMQNQVMSAVRIPEAWGGLREPLDPLDISRVLINRYVGQNYDMVAVHP
jgi:hypothetical protein